MITCRIVCDRLAFSGKITLRDLKRCKLSHIFFDTFFNIEKYLEHEQKDPFSVIRVSDVNQHHHFLSALRWLMWPFLPVLQELEADGQEVSDWEKYAAEEYDILVAEEAANEECNEV